MVEHSVLVVVVSVVAPEGTKTLALSVQTGTAVPVQLAEGDSVVGSWLAVGSESPLSSSLLSSSPFSLPPLFPGPGGGPGGPGGGPGGPIGGGNPLNEIPLPPGQMTGIKQLGLQRGPMHCQARVGITVGTPLTVVGKSILVAE